VREGVYAKTPFDGSAHVLRLLGRYTCLIVILVTGPPAWRTRPALGDLLLQGDRISEAKD